MNKCKISMPLYAIDNSFVISGEQLQKILRGKNPFKSDSPNYSTISKRSSYRVAQLKDGSWWVENFRYGAPLFAPDYWWRIPVAAGRRAEKLNKFIKEEL